MSRHLSNVEALSLLLIGLGVVITTVLLLSLKFSSKVAMAVFLAWLLAPYALMLFVIARRKSGRNVLWSALACLLVGIGFLIDIRLIHPDPQAAIAILLVPLVQFAVTAAIFALLK